MKLSPLQKQDLKTLESRDLMYFLLDMYEHSYIDGDNITAFLDDNLSDNEVRLFIEEATDD